MIETILIDEIESCQAKGIPQYKDNLHSLCDYLKNNIFNKFITKDGPMCAAGGFIRKWLNNEYYLCSDIDLYFNSLQDIEHNLNKFHNYIIAKKFNAITIKIPDIEYPIDLVTISLDGRKAIDDFDFSICACEIYNTDVINFHENFFIDLASKTIRIINKCDISVLCRIQKYIQKGYTIIDTSDQSWHNFYGTLEVKSRYKKYNELKTTSDLKKLTVGEIIF